MPAAGVPLSGACAADGYGGAGGSGAGVVVGGGAVVVAAAADGELDGARLWRPPRLAAEGGG